MFRGIDPARQSHGSAGHPVAGEPLGDEQLAVALATGAGRLLQEVRASAVFESALLGDAGDAIAQAFLARALSAHRPGDRVLSEEATDDPGRVGAARVWIIDPLDGTREYREGRDDWAVHVALVLDGSPGPSAVAIPDGAGTFSPQSTLPPAVAGRRRQIAVSRSRPPQLAVRVADALEAELVPIGSAGVKAMAVVSGEVDAYIHAGGQYEWDSAAPVGVALAAGLHASRIDGSRLVYNQADPLLPDLLICRPELAGELLRALAAGATGPEG